MGNKVIVKEKKKPKSAAGKVNTAAPKPPMPQPEVIKKGKKDKEW